MKTLAACATGILLMALAIWYRPAEADDFGPFYRAATLSAEHRSVYADPTFTPHTGQDGKFLPFLRTPFYAAALRPLAALPYQTARRIWIAILVLSVLASLWLFPAGRRRFALALSISFPLGEALMVGQDIPLVLLIALAAARIYSAGREFLAGLVLSLLGMKVTYLPAAALVVLAKSRRGALGVAAGGVIQLAVSYVVGGATWPSDYFALLKDPRLDPAPLRMLNLRVLAEAVSLPAVVYTLAGVALYAGLWLVSKRMSLADGLTLALPLGMIASPHCQIYDAVVLVPLFAQVASLNSRVGLIAFFALTPVLYLVVLLTPAPWLQAGSALVVCATMAAAGQLYGRRAGCM